MANRRASTSAIFSDRRSRGYNSTESLTRGSFAPRRCRVQSTIISSTARVCALAARYMHLNLISGAKGKDGQRGGREREKDREREREEGQPVTPFATATPTNGRQPAPPFTAATAARSWLQLLQLSVHIIRAHYAEPRLSMPAVTSRFRPTVPIRLPRPKPREFRLRTRNFKSEIACETYISRIFTIYFS